MQENSVNLWSFYCNSILSVWMVLFVANNHDCLHSLLSSKCFRYLYLFNPHSRNTLGSRGYHGPNFALRQRCELICLRHISIKWWPAVQSQAVWPRVTTFLPACGHFWTILANLVLFQRSLHYDDSSERLFGDSFCFLALSGHGGRLWDLIL